MQARATAVAGAFVIEGESVTDSRGRFLRTWDADAYAAVGMSAPPEQCSLSFNTRRGTLRGLHLQAAPHEESKLIRCTRGRVFDVVADVRPDSATFGRWEGIELDPTSALALWVPPGCAHGFQTLEDESELAYQISAAYVPSLSRGVIWSDPALAIDWPMPEATIVSERDASLPTLADYVRARERDDENRPSRGQVDDVCIREPRDGDWPVLAALRNDRQVQLDLMALPRASSLRRVGAWVEGVLDDPRSLFFVIARRDDDGALGFVQLRELDFVHGVGRLGVAVVQEARGTGAAGAGIRLLESHAHDVLGVRKVELRVLARNARAHRLYSRLGYRAVGRLTAHHYQEGEYHDVLIMEKLLRNPR